MKGGTKVNLIFPHSLHQTISEHISSMENSDFVIQRSITLSDPIIGRGAENIVHNYNKESVIISSHNSINTSDELEHQLENIILLLFLKKINIKFIINFFTSLENIITDGTNYYLVFKKYRSDMAYYLYRLYDEILFDDKPLNYPFINSQFKNI